MKNKKFRNQGLPALNESRFDRRRQMVTGRAKVGGGIPPRLFGLGLLVLLVGGVLYFRNAQAELERQRDAILQKQRATAKLLTPRLTPLRDRIEAYALELAQPGADYIDREVDWRKLLAEPGVYLRVLSTSATTAESLREAATDSLRDGFTSCAFLDRKAQLPTSGQACKESTDCTSGEFCNEFSFCQRPSSPFNMRMVYRALSILSPEWVSTLRETNSDYKLVAMDRTLESVTRVDIPIAIDIRERAQFAVIVLDEDPPEGVPASLPGVFESEAERVQRVAHFARVGVWDLKEGQLLARVRSEASGALRSAGTKAPDGGAESQAARARQANSCALALSFKARLGVEAADR